ncbi:uncharacterized protein ISCGN_003010 [Ixodes scapularis]
MQQGEPSDPPPATVAAAAVRLPPYWDRNPRVWFLQAESQFHLAGVTTQGRKYHHVVSALSPAAADEVYDVLANPSPATQYDQLKNALLQRTEVSERSRVHQLLSAEELGDRRPSQLLRRMTQDLQDATHVFVRQSQKKPLRPHCIGHFPVVENRSDTFVLRVNGKNDTVALERLKPAHIEQAHVQEIALRDIDQTTGKSQLRWHSNVCVL